MKLAGYWARSLCRLLPPPPMGRTDIDLLPRIRVDLLVKHATARKYENMCASVVDNSQLKLAIECSVGYFLPRQ